MKDINNISPSNTLNPQVNDKINDHLHILIAKLLKHVNKIKLLIGKYLNKFNITIKHAIVCLVINS